MKSIAITSHCHFTGVATIQRVIDAQPWLSDSVANGNIFCNVSLHSVPPAGFLDWDLGTSYSLLDEWNKQTREPLEVSYPSTPQSTLIEILVLLRHTDPSSIPQHGLVILCKSGWLFFLNIALYLQDLLIFQLTFLNILELE
jgi:hypothetical protein